MPRAVWENGRRRLPGVHQWNVFKKAVKNNKGLERSFKIIQKELYETLEKEMEELGK